jgi:pimeloyl-ACP methyl ester carboxylesterase
MKQLLQLGHFSSADQEPLFVKIEANAQKVTQTLFFIHGIGGDHSAYQGIIERLTQTLPRTRFVSYDLRGHGRSSRIFTHHYPSLEAAHLSDLQTLITEYLEGKLILVGQSLGSLVIQEYLREHRQPLPLKTFFICSSLQSPPLSFNRQWWFKQWQHRPRPVQPQQIRTFDDHLSFANSSDYHLKRVISDINSTTLYSWFMHWVSILGWSNPEPEMLNQPHHTFIHGKRDYIIFPFLRKRIVTKLPAAKHLVLDVNHNCLAGGADQIAITIQQDVQSALSAKIR